MGRGEGCQKGQALGWKGCLTSPPPLSFQSQLLEKAERWERKQSGIAHISLAPRLFGARAPLGLCERLLSNANDRDAEGGVCLFVIVVVVPLLPHLQATL